MPKLVSKTNEWSNSATSIGQNDIELQPIIFHGKYASTRNAHMLCLGTGGNAVNKSFDFFDITTGGTYQLMIGGICFLQMQLDAGTNRSSIFKNKKNAKYVVWHDKAISAAATTFKEPGKFIVKINTTRLG